MQVGFHALALDPRGLANKDVDEQRDEKRRKDRLQHLAQHSAQSPAS